MGQHTVRLAILFADISGSTRLYDTLGDTDGRGLIARCLAVMAEVSAEYQGTVIKTMGDEVMCTFPDAESAVHAAREMQERVERTSQSADSRAPMGVSIRIGLHYGSAISEGGDVFGDAVNVAAKMASQANPGQIITTRTTLQMLSAELRASTRYLDRITLKGKSEHIQLYEVLWYEDDVTRRVADVLSNAITGGRLRLTYLGQEVVLGGQTGPFILGRGKQVQLVVDDSLVSRQHATLENRRGKFVLTDHSTNGTYLLTELGPVYLHREEIALQGEGKISLGTGFDEAPSSVILYCCED